MGAPEVEAFLTHLTVEGHVAASTQNQALSALLFLYREVPAHLTFRQRLQGQLDAVRHPGARRDLLHRELRLLVGIAQRQQRIDDIAAVIVGKQAADRADIGAQLALQLQQQALGGFLATCPPAFAAGEPPGEAVGSQSGG